MAGPGNIIISVGVEAGKAVAGLRDVNSGLEKTATAGSKMKAGLAKAALPAAAALTAIGVAAKKAIDSASGLNEQINKTATVFGPAGKEMEAWSKTLVNSFGMSQESALEAAGTFGNMLVPMGFARKDAATMSEQMVQLAGDMASFNNADPSETLAALGSGLAGQSEPLRKFGVFLSDARLKQVALSQGLWDGKGALDAHAKASATYAIVMKDTADAQGDFAKTSSGVANQQRIQAAATANLTASLGQSLLPAMQAIQAILIKVTAFTAEHTTAVKVLVGAVAILSAGIIAANIAIKAYTVIQAAAKVASVAWTAAQWLLNAALSANPIGLVVVAIAALAAGLVLAYKHSETFRNIVNAAFAAVVAAVQPLRAAFDALLAGAKAAYDWIVSHWQVAQFAFGPLAVAITAIAQNWDKVAGAARAAADAVVAAVGAMVGAIERVIGVIHSAVGAVEGLISALGRIHVPDIHLPSIPGLNAAGYYGAPAVAGYGSSSRAAGPTTINVYGAIDPEGTARTIRRVLAEHDRRMGRSA